MDNGWLLAIISGLIGGALAPYVVRFLTGENNKNNIPTSGDLIAWQITICHAIF